MHLTTEFHFMFQLYISPIYDFSEFRTLKSCLQCKLLSHAGYHMYRVSVVSLHYSLDTLWRPLGACEHNNRANDGEPPSRLFKVKIGNWVKMGSGRFTLNMYLLHHIWWVARLSNAPVFGCLHLEGFRWTVFYKRMSTVSSPPQKPQISSSL
jgi:hypothetical protein